MTDEVSHKAQPGSAALRGWRYRPQETMDAPWGVVAADSEGGCCHMELRVSVPLRGNSLPYASFVAVLRSSGRLLTRVRALPVRRRAAAASPVVRLIDAEYCRECAVERRSSDWPLHTGFSWKSLISLTVLLVVPCVPPWVLIVALLGIAATPTYFQRNGRTCRCRRSALRPKSACIDLHTTRARPTSPCSGMRLRAAPATTSTTVLCKKNM